MSDSLSLEFGSRLVPLCDGRPGLRGGLPVQVCDTETVPPGAPIIDFIASSEALDRYDEILSADGWRLDNYRRNPVFQNAHQYGDIIFTLGKALITEVRLVGSASPSGPPRQVLFQRILFATDVNPMARIAYGLYKGKFLNAVSVGFIPIRWENGDASVGQAFQPVGEGGFPPTRSSAGKRETFKRKYLEQELLEVSAVGIPANPEALQLALKAGAVEKSDLRDLADFLRRAADSPASAPEPASPHSASDFGLPPSLHYGATGRTSDSVPIPSALGPRISDLHFPGTSAAPNAPAGASGIRGNEAQLLRLAREIQRVLRGSRK